MEGVKYMIDINPVINECVILKVKNNKCIAMFTLNDTAKHFSDNNAFSVYDSELKCHYTFDSVQGAIDFMRSKTDNCPSEGEFYGYKKAVLYRATDQGPMYEGECIITLLIPADSPRTGCYYEKKCRARFARVVRIECLGTDNTIVCDVNEKDGLFGVSGYCYYNRIPYILGETVVADRFDPNKEVACSNGIHFFLNKEEALAYDVWR